MRPTLSVIIPVYNGEQYLSAALDSVLAQSLPPTDILVVDDGSTDRTAQIVQQYPSIRYTYQENSGTGAARNRGIDMTTGDLIAFLDADDLWLPKKLEWQVASLADDENYDAITGYIENFISPELDPESMRHVVVSDKPLPGHLISALMIRRASLGRLGLFVQDNVPLEFVHWFVRARDQGMRLKMLPQVLVRRRIHKSNQGIVRRKEISAITGILKSSLDRRRKASNT